MSALAECLIQMNTSVSGSDFRASPETDRLASLGAKIHIGHAPGNIGNAELVVASDAINADNLERREAKLRSIPVWRRGTLLARLCDNRISIMVAGSHGKTSTAAMIATVLQEAGLEPGFAIGAPVGSLAGRRAAAGKGPHFVAEACEAFQNLAAFEPDVAVVTNIDNDHLEHYGSQQRLDSSFAAFASRARLGVVANGDDDGLKRVLPTVTASVSRYGSARTDRVAATNIEFVNSGTTFNLLVSGEDAGRVTLGAPGHHMVQNALACIGACLLLGLEAQTIIRGLAAFKGADRRWQNLGTFNGVEIVDDYAHHPTALAAVFAAAQHARRQDQRLVIAFQPHLYSRTQRLLEEFAAQLARWDQALLVEIDGGGERGGDASDTSLLAQRIRALGGRSTLVDGVEELARHAPSLLHAGDFVVIAGSGSVAHAAPKVAEALRLSEAVPENHSQGRTLHNQSSYAPPQTERAQDALNVLDLFLEIARRAPNHIAVSERSRSLSYADLDRASNALARMLKTNGTQDGDAVGVRLRSSIELIVVIIALAKLGAVYVPIDRSSPARRADYMMKRARVRCLIAERRDDELLKITDASWLDSSAVTKLLASDVGVVEIERVASRAGRHAYICFTSGSTGAPKGVPINESSLYNFVMEMHRWLNIDASTVAAFNTTISFDVSLAEIWTTLCGGGRLCATGSDKPLLGDRLADYLEREFITHIAVTPSVMATVDPRAVTHLRCIVTAGETCTQKLVADWAPGRKFFNAYGPTETTIYATIAQCFPNEPISIGMPFQNLVSLVLDEDSNPIESGTGELLLGGWCLTDGYLDGDEKASVRFVDLPHNGRLERFYRTGDIVRRELGTLYFVGRLDDQIKINGVRVELGEIEHALLQIPAISAAAACIDERSGHKELICFVVMRYANDFDWATAQQELAHWLPASMIPARCIPTPEIFLTPNGKTDRHKLLQSYRKRSIRAISYTAPRTDTEARLAELWKDVLETTTDIGVYESFTNVGGDSLKTILLIMAVEKNLGLDVPPGYFGQITTIERMAVQIDELVSSPELAPSRDPALFTASRLYKSLRDLTAGWSGERSTPQSLIFSMGGARAKYHLFICVQLEHEVTALSEHLGPEFRVHGMRSGHLVMDYTPETVDALAAYYVENIKSIGPRLPVFVAGICQGATIAAAVAVMLKRQHVAVPLLIALEQARLAAYDGDIAFFFTEDSFLNPYTRFSNGLERFDEIYAKRYSIDLVPGVHGTIHHEPNVSVLASKLRMRVEAAARAAQAERDKGLLGTGHPPVELRGGANASNAVLSDVKLIEASRLFDAEYYVSNLSAEVSPHGAPSRHYCEVGWRLGADPGPLFSTRRYLGQYPDVAAAEANPLAHYLRFGINENRQGWSEFDLISWQRDLVEDASLAMREIEAQSSSIPVLRRGDVVIIHAHSRGHLVFKEFQRLLGLAFEAIGIRCILADEQTVDEPAVAALRFVVAPHDFYRLEGGPSPDDARFAQSVPINSEQMQSYWFNLALPYLRRAPFTLDLNVQTAASLVRLGLNARFLPLGFTERSEIFHPQARFSGDASRLSLDPSIADLPGSPDTPFGGRPIDVLFIGSNSPRRTQFVDEHRDFFASTVSFVRLVDVIGELPEGDPRAISTRDFAGLSQRSKILLNSHHFDAPYFEWQRLMHFGLFQGCCVVTERASRVPGLVPNEHYFEEEWRNLRGLMQWLLNDEDGRRRAEEVRSAGQKAALLSYNLERTVAQLFNVGPPTSDPVGP